MARLLGIGVLVVGLYAALVGGAGGGALGGGGVLPLTREQAYFAVLTLGAATVIITGGIDLSVGSVVGLGAVVFGQLLGKGWMPLSALGVIVVLGAAIGLVHGLLITKLKLQPFLV